MADGLPVIIQELAVPFRNLTLAGRSMPKPVRVGAEQHAIQTWYPGAGKASAQVMGVREDPLILEGRWDDPAGTLLPQINPFGAGTRAKLARGLMEGQALCQLLWGTTIVVQGRVKRFEILYQKANRTDYRIVFEVDQSNSPTALTPLPILNIDPARLIAVAAAVAVAGSIMVNAVDSGSDIGGAA